MSTKRKQIVITIKKKLEVINRVEKSELFCTVAADLNVRRSTVSDWMKGKGKVIKFLQNSVLGNHIVQL